MQMSRLMLGLCVAMMTFALPGCLLEPDATGLCDAESCDECTQLSGCGWCPGRGCVAGTSAGPSVPRSCRDDYRWDECTFEICEEHSRDGCEQSERCHYCRTSGCTPNRQTCSPFVPDPNNCPSVAGRYQAVTDGCDTLTEIELDIRQTECQVFAHDVTYRFVDGAINEVPDQQGQLEQDGLDSVRGVYQPGPSSRLHYHFTRPDEGNLFSVEVTLVGVNCTFVSGPAT